MFDIHSIKYMNNFNQNCKIILKELQTLSKIDNTIENRFKLEPEFF